MAAGIGLKAVMDIAGFTQGINQYNKILGDTSSKTDKHASLMSKALGGIGTGLKIGIAGVAGLAAGAGAAAGGIAALVLKTAASSDELVEMSDKTGISVERLQELKFIGEQTGTGVETVTGALARLTRGMGDAATGGAGPAAEAFKTLGISVVDADGNLRDSQVVFGEALTALGSVGNETERDALAMEIFGKSAQELNPLINAGAEGMAEMSQQARDMGAVLSEDSVNSMADLNDSIGALKAGFGGIVSQLATAFLPMFQGVVKWMQDTLMPFIQNTLVPWIQENLPKAIATLSAFWESTLKPAIEKVWEFLSTTVIPFIRDTLVPWLEENVPKAIQTLSDFWEDPLRVAIDAAWKFVEENIIPFIRDTLIPFLEEKIPLAAEALGEAFTWLKDEIITPLSEGIGGLVDWVKDAWEWIGNLIEKLKSPIQIPDWLEAILPGGSPSPLEESLRGINAVLPLVTGNIQKFLDTVISESENAFDAIMDVSGAFGSLGSTAASMFEADIIDPMRAQLEGIDERRAKFLSSSILKRYGITSLEAAKIVRKNETLSPAEFTWITKYIELERERARLVKDISAEEEKIVKLREQQEKLSFLKQQFDLLETIRKYGLDPGEILGGMKLGLNASVEDLIAAMTRAMQEMVKAAEKELGIGSPSKVFVRIAENITKTLASTILRTGKLPEWAMSKVAAGMALPLSSRAMASNVTYQTLQVPINANINTGMDLAMFKNFITQTVQEAFLQ